MTDDLYEQLREKYHGAHEDRRGNVYIPCPNCGREEKKFSFSPRGANCFSCGFQPSLKELLGDDFKPDPHWKPLPKPKPIVRPWQRDPFKFLTLFQDHPRLIELWQQYRPVNLETIAYWKLGAGLLPSTACDHLRLIYPVISVGKIIGFRGRAVTCSCPKWLSSAGSQVHLMGVAFPYWPLFVVESPVDAMLILQELHGVGACAGTGGANTWRDEWTEKIALSMPEFVVVLYDNDLAGAATGTFREELAREWMEKHPQAQRPPKANAEMVAGHLRQAGLRVNILRWPPDTPKGADVGWLAAREIEK